MHNITHATIYGSQLTWSAIYGSITFTIVDAKERYVTTLTLFLVKAQDDSVVAVSPVAEDYVEAIKGSKLERKSETHTVEFNAGFERDYVPGRQGAAATLTVPVRGGSAEPDFGKMLEACGLNAINNATHWTWGY